MSRRFLKNQEQRINIAGRIKEVVDATYNNDAEFEREFNIAPGTYGHTQKGKFTIEFLIEFCEKHRINLNWLLRKVGKRDLTPSESKQPTQ